MIYSLWDSEEVERHEHYRYTNNPTDDVFKSNLEGLIRHRRT